MTMPYLSHFSQSCLNPNWIIQSIFGLLKSSPSWCFKFVLFSTAIRPFKLSTFLQWNRFYSIKLFVTCTCKYAHAVKV